MSAVYLATFEGGEGEFQTYPLKRIKESAALDIYKKHYLVDCPEKAEIILFATNAVPFPAGLSYFCQSLYRKYPTKCVLFNSGDYPSPLVGGLCASWPMLKLRNAAPSTGWCYFHPTSAEPFIEARHASNKPKYLWSFVGSSSTHAIRKSLFLICDTEAYMRDTSLQTLPNLMGFTNKELSEEFRDNYIKLLSESKFVVCPRGAGASSMRIFEAMRAGRPPVIISDEWTPPPFVEWNLFSIRIKERDINKLPAILREHESRADEMGAIALREWSRVFGVSGLFHFTVESSFLVLKEQQKRGTLSKLAALKYLLERPYNRELMRFFKNHLIALAGQMRSSRF